jgi:hypothetical protein
MNALLASTALSPAPIFAPAVLRGLREEDDKPRVVHRGWRTADELMTFDRSAFTTDGMGNMLGRRFDRAFRSHDGKWYDSTGAFLLGELVRLDQTLHMPLVSVSWGRDIDLRQDVSLADDASSYTVSTFGSPAGLGMTNAITGGKAWIGKNTTQISSVSVDIALNTRSLRPWALELKYTVLELESALKLGRPVDQQKYEAIKMKHQMDVDAQVYVGDSDTGDAGLVNQPVSPGPGQPGVGIITNVAAGAGTGNPTGWQQGKTPAEILTDFNFALNTVWGNAGWAVVPQLVSTAGTTSILRYVEENNILARSGQGKLEIYPLKWCNGAGAGGTIGTASPGVADRMVVYSKDPNHVRIPLTMLSRTPIQYDAIWQKASYYGKLGVLETVYPETIGYFDRI